MFQVADHILQKVFLNLEDMRKSGLLTLFLQAKISQIVEIYNLSNEWPEGEIFPLSAKFLSQYFRLDIKKAPTGVGARF